MDSEQDWERLLSLQRHTRGRARVALGSLQFEEETVRAGRRLDSKNVERLVRAYEQGTCLRRDPRHFIAGIIPDNVLQEALSSCGVGQDALFAAGEPPFLDMGAHSITCLHGKHRIEAAKQYFGQVDDWWIIDLYSPGW